MIAGIAKIRVAHSRSEAGISREPRSDPAPAFVSHTLPDMFAGAFLLGSDGTARREKYVVTTIGPQTLNSYNKNGVICTSLFLCRP